MEKKNTREAETQIYDDASKIITCLLLPFDLSVDEILTRIPVKSLARFRCVSKLWLHLLTSDPKFAMRQHKLSQQSASSLSLISSRIQPESGMVNIIHDISTTTVTVTVKKGTENLSSPLSFSELIDCTAVSNPVNGLVACGYETIHRSRPLSCHYLLNPSTRELVRLPPTSRDDRWGILGFGYYSSPEKEEEETECCYKLVRLFSAAASSRIRFCKCEVLTIGGQNQQNNYWRYLGDAPTALPFGQPVFINGSIHWMALAPTDADDRGVADVIILTFDVREDKFRLMTVPEKAHPQHMGLGDYGGGRLCVTVLHEPSTWNIWVLRDYYYSKQTEWTKLHVISTVLPDKRLISCPRFIGTKDGKLLLQNVANHCFQPVYSYDPRTDTFSLLLSPNQAFPHLRFYAESLISPASLLT